MKIFYLLGAIGKFGCLVICLFFMIRVIVSWERLPGKEEKLDQTNEPADELNSSRDGSEEGHGCKNIKNYRSDFLPAFFHFFLIS